MGVSVNRGTPKSSSLIGFSIINHPFWGIPIFGNTHIVHVFNSKSTSAFVSMFLWICGLFFIYCRSSRDEVEALDIDFQTDPMVLDLNLKSTFKESKSKVNPSGQSQTPCLGGGFKDFLFSSLPGKMIQFDSYFSIGLKPPTSCSYFFNLFHFKTSRDTTKHPYNEQILASGYLRYQIHTSTVL